MRMRIALLAIVAVAACDPRSCLAQTPLFASLRPDLVKECCACLANNTTTFPGSACAETFIVDGGPAIAIDAGPANPADAGPDYVPVAVPCMCEDGEASCRAALTRGVPILVTGACVSQGSGPFVRKAPCQDACNGVLSFEPLASP